MTDQQTQKTTIAFFDFDGTLAKGESLWPFLIYAVGLPRFLYASFLALIARLLNPSRKDKRTFFKEVLLLHTLRGKNKTEMAPAGNRLKQWVRWIEPSVAALREHHKKGHHIVIASGSLDIYLDYLLVALPHDAVICTQMEIKEGKLTGRMFGRNCVRESKAQRVKEYMDTHGPFDDSYAYGNAPHDLPMMECVKNRIIIQ